LEKGKNKGGGGGKGKSPEKDPKASEHLGCKKGKREYEITEPQKDAEKRRDNRARRSESGEGKKLAARNLNSA